MYGPPPDAREVAVAWGLADVPGAWAWCLLIGLGLVALGWRRRGLALIAGLTVLLTAPALGLIPRAVWGAFPTIDKAGSLLFYAQGVQWRLLHPEDPALQLIGVHVGHLWITALLDLVLEPFAAMGAQSLLNLALSWAAAALFCGALAEDRRAGVLLGLGFGLGLHQLRDVQWYTVEKTALYPLPLYAWGLWRLHTGAKGPMPTVLPALAALAAFLLNVYVGLLCVFVGVATVLAAAPTALRAGPPGGHPTTAARRARRVLLAVLLSGLACVPPVALQALLTRNNTVLPGPEAFLHERAALDVFTLWPPAWNRLEAWRALDPVGLLLGLAALPRILDRPAARLAVLVAAVAFVFALGPLDNPVYLAAFEAVPGFWRVAKPETFVHLAWLAWLGLAALGWRAAARRRGPLGDRAWLALLLTSMGLWWGLVRTHPVYPGFTEPVEGRLPADWAERQRPASEAEQPGSPPPP